MAMIRQWLIIDCDNLIWRSYYGIRNSLVNSPNSLASEVTYTFLRDVMSLQKIHMTKRVIFCFDHIARKRHLIYKGYKSKRKVDKNDPEHENKKIVKLQLKDLKLRILEELGFKNIFYQTGYESDDVIASVCKNLTNWDRGIIISSDMDFYQLLTKRVMIWHPIKKESVTKKSFIHKYGIRPKQWALVKSLTGCHSDCIPGIERVGEITALRYIRKELMESSKAYQIIGSNKNIVKRNLRLIRLPLEGTENFYPREDRISRASWNELADILERKAIEEHILN